LETHLEAQLVLPEVLWIAQQELWRTFTVQSVGSHLFFRPILDKRISQNGSIERFDLRE
jgi:hypothetical protein